ncbi:MAG: chemotaxis protein CheX [Treponema sp.]|jgi:chemotaxis protein CheX|nr:chemotaxis protein CheX [Treponema sp.]
MEQYVKPFVDVTVETFKSFVNHEVSPQVPFVSSKAITMTWDISALIGVSGKFNGSMLIAMQKDLALKLTDTIVGSAHTDMDADVTDAVGEIINIIGGNIKRIVQEGERIMISLPTVVKGPDHSITWSAKRVQVLCIPFTVSDGAVFHLLWAIETAKGL